MFAVSKNPVLSRALMDALLSALQGIPADELLGDCECRLFTNDVQPTLDSVPGDFTSATFAGYVDVTILPAAWSDPGNYPSSRRGLTAPAVFTGGAVVAPGESIRGYLLCNAAGTVLHLAERFAAPIPISNPGDFLSLDIVIPLAPAQPTGL